MLKADLAGELNVGVRVWGIYPISAWQGGGSSGEGKEKWASYVPQLIISALASYLQLARGLGSFLIKSQLLYFTQDDLITFYVGVLDCLIITTFWPCSLPINSSELSPIDL